MTLVQGTVGSRAAADGRDANLKRQCPSVRAPKARRQAGVGRHIPKHHVQPNAHLLCLLAATGSLDGALWYLAPWSVFPADDGCPGALMITMKPNQCMQRRLFATAGRAHIPHVAFSSPIPVSAAPPRRVQHCCPPIHRPALPSRPSAVPGVSLARCCPQVHWMRAGRLRDVVVLLLPLRSSKFTPSPRNPHPLAPPRASHPSLQCTWATTSMTPASGSWSAPLRSMATWTALSTSRVRRRRRFPWSTADPCHLGSCFPGSLAANSDLGHSVSSSGYVPNPGFSSPPPLPAARLGACSAGSAPFQLSGKARESTRQRSSPCPPAIAHASRPRQHACLPSLPTCLATHPAPNAPPAAQACACPACAT